MTVNLPSLQGIQASSLDEIVHLLNDNGLLSNPETKTL
jgi:hypothetical protein